MLLNLSNKDTYGNNIKKSANTEWRSMCPDDSGNDNLHR
nr:MAG TPA: hypothetical protein [Caudoviricetes sp.]